MVDSGSIRARTWGLFAVLVFFMIFGPSNLKYFWLAFWVLFSLALMWTLYLAYACERFTVYMVSLLVTIVGAFSIMACSLAYFAAAKIWGRESISAIAVGFAPAILVGTMYWMMSKGKPSFHPFEYDGIKVQPRSQKNKKTSSSHNLFLVGGITTLGGNVFISVVGLEAAGIVAMVSIVGFCMGYLFYARHVLRGLRILKAQEKNMPVPYTFMNIDSIREARSHWWMSRLFKWIASKGKSSTV